MQCGAHRRNPTPQHLFGDRLLLGGQRGQDGLAMRSPRREPPGPAFGRRGRRGVLPRGRLGRPVASPWPGRAAPGGAVAAAPGPGRTFPALGAASSLGSGSPPLAFGPGPPLGSVRPVPRTGGAVAFPGRRFPTGPGGVAAVGPGPLPLASGAALLAVAPAVTGASTDTMVMPSISNSASARRTSPALAPPGSRPPSSTPRGSRAPAARHVQEPSGRALVNSISMRRATGPR
jgi:hypothetical protein